MSGLNKYLSHYNPNVPIFFVYLITFEPRTTPRCNAYKCFNLSQSNTIRPSTTSPLHSPPAPASSSTTCRWPRHRICRMASLSEAPRRRRASTPHRTRWRTAKAPTLARPRTAPRSSLPDEVIYRTSSRCKRLEMSENGLWNNSRFSPSVWPGLWNNSRLFTISVTRLGGVLKLSVTNLIVKVAQIFGDFGGSFDNHSIWSKICRGSFLGNFGKKLGYLFSQHLVTLFTNAKMSIDVEQWILFLMFILWKQLLYSDCKC